MTTAVIGLFAETSIHPGAESTGGLIDLPVAREAATGYPFLPGTSLKGSLRNKAGKTLEKKDVEILFGLQDKAGGIATTDARLLLLPVRSLTGNYVWVTCPYLIERLVRDLQLAGKPSEISIEGPLGFQAFATMEGKLYLEDLLLEGMAKPELIKQLADIIAPLVGHESVRSRLERQLVLVSDDMMAYFSRYNLSVQARNKLHDETKVSENLWYEEALPPDTLLYFLLLPRPEQSEGVASVVRLFSKNPYIQVGGNETMGQGWCITSQYRGK